MIPPMSGVTHTPNEPPEAGGEQSGLTRFRVYAVCSPERASRLPGLPGLEPGTIRMVDPRVVSSKPFLDAIDRVISGGPKPIPRWALYDCAETTGVVLGCLDHRGGPVSLLAATPTTTEKEWLVFALRAHDPGLSIRTARLAVELLEPRALTAVCPYRGGAIDVLTTLGPASLVTAYTAAENEPMSATIRVRPGAPGPDGGHAERIDTRCEQALRRLQSEIEQGNRFEITAGPDRDGLLIVEKTDAPHRIDR